MKNLVQTKTVKSAKVTKSGKTVKASKAIEAKAVARKAVVTKAVSEKLTEIRALHNEAGKLDGIWCTVSKEGLLAGKAHGEERTQLGAYVGGGRFGSSGVKVELLDAKQASARLKACTFSYRAKLAHKDAVKDQIGLAVGDAAKAECIGIFSLRGTAKSPYAWQVEQDSNDLNKHERGQVEYCKETGAHKAVRSALLKSLKGNVKLALLSGQGSRSRGCALRMVEVK